MRAAMNSSHTSGGSVLIGCRAMRPPSSMPVYIPDGLRAHFCWHKFRSLGVPASRGRTGHAAAGGGGGSWCRTLDKQVKDSSQCR